MDKSSFLRLPFKFPLRRFSSVPCLQTSSDSEYSPTPSLPAHLAHANPLDTVESTENTPITNPVEVVSFDVNSMIFENRISDEDDELSILNIFDPLRPSISSPESEEILPDEPLDQTSLPLFPHPIKIRLKLFTCSEMKPFYQLVQHIRDEYQTKETFSREIVYCKRVRRLTSQHLEQNQFPVTLFIFTDQSKEAIRLPNVNLQSTVAHILNELLELIPFDYNQSILKLRSYEEYLCPEDVLCDIEYVHRCINALKPLQFVLMKKPRSFLTPKPDVRTFEQFCFDHSDEYFRMTEQQKLMKLTDRTRPILSTEQTRWFMPSDSRWLEEFQQGLKDVLKEIERCFNELLGENRTLKEQIKLVDDFIQQIKNIEAICSHIRSPMLFDQIMELKKFKIHLQKHEESVTISEDFIRLFWNILRTIGTYIQNYCQAFLIPYGVEFSNQVDQPIDIEQLMDAAIFCVSNSCPIVNAVEKFTLRIDSLFSLPRHIKTVCVVARVCYGNETKGKAMTRLISCVRNRFSEGSSQIRFHEQLLFENIYLCGLHRESLILFEIYADFIEETDGFSLTREILHGIPMYLVGWCSQGLFDSEDHLIHGERYLGIIDSAIVRRMGFYSLRNVFDHECSMLTVTFTNHAIYWPKVQARKDMLVQNFTEISRDKQEYLCRLLDRPNLLLTDHSTMMVNESNRSQQFDQDDEFPADDYQMLWSHRSFLTHKSYALPKLLQSRSVWDYASLIDIYGLVDLITRDRTIDEIESFQLLLPAFPDMHIRSFAYRSLISHINTYDLLLYLPQLLQIIKFDYHYSSPIISHLLQQSIEDHRLAHKLYWYLRQLLLMENIHFIRYYYFFMALSYVIGENFRVELEHEYQLGLKLKRIGSELKTSKFNRRFFLNQQLTILNEDFFQSGEQSCRLPCQFNFLTNSIDLNSCTVFSSGTSPMKIVFNPIDPSGEKYFSIYKVGDDLRQDQIVLQLLACMDKIWQANDLDFRLSLFNVVQTEERCGFIEMVTESETILEIERPLGTIRGSFGESPLYDWIRANNTTEREFRIAIENLSYSCAGYCVATYILGIGDRHNENIMVKKSGQLFHIDFGKYLGDTQKFGWFNRDRAPLIFTKQMLFAMSDGGTSSDAIHRFIDLCCNAFYTLRQNAPLLLLLLSHLCSSNVPNLNSGALKYVYDRLALSSNYAESITHFTNLIFDSLNSAWIQFNGLIHKLAQPNSLTSTLSSARNGPTLSFVPNTYTIFTDGKIHSAQVVNHEKRNQFSRFYLYKIRVERVNSSYNYRTYNEFYELYERLNKQFPLIGLDLKYSQQAEDKMLAQRRVSDINDFLGHFFRLNSEITESDLVCTFFHIIQRDQQLNDLTEKLNPELTSRSSSDFSSKIRLQLKYDDGKLFVMIRHASNLPSKNGYEPRPYCKCYLFPDENKATKRKGKIVNSRNPSFYDTFIYEFDLAEIQKRVLRVSIWNSVVISGNRVLGQVDIVLAQIDWSKDNACDYTLVSLDSPTVPQRYSMTANTYLYSSTEILSLRFNQDSSCFVCATNDGIRVFNVEPFAQKCFLELGRATYAEMLYRTNLIAYVPADHVTGLPSNVVSVYDDQQKKPVLELCFNTSVASIRMSLTRLFVVLVNKILVFSFPNSCQLLHTIETRENPRGLCEVSNSDGSLLAFPSNSKAKGGFIQLLNINGFEEELSYKPRIIHAHANELATMALSPTGNLLATASKRGTLIRIFLTTGLCERLFEFRRGSDTADIYSIAFSFDCSFLSVSSDKGTVHIYALRDTKSNRKTALSHAINDASGDLCNFKADNEYPCVCTFSGLSHVVATSFTGAFYKYKFVNEGKCFREEFDLFLDGIDGCDF